MTVDSDRPGAGAVPARPARGGARVGRACRLAGRVALLATIGAFVAACSSGTSAHDGSAATTSATASRPASTSSGSATSASRAAGATKAGRSGSARTTGPTAAAATSSATARTTTTVPVTNKITASPTPFSKPVAYPDGIDLAILKVTQHTITDTGPGAMTGKPQTTFTVRFTNNSHRSISLNQVVVTVHSGLAERTASPVYGGTSVNDFAGSVEPGKSEQTNYAFSIPTANLTHVTMSVAFDGLHAAATFSGRVVTN